MMHSPRLMLRQGSLVHLFLMNAFFLWLQVTGFGMVVAIAYIKRPSWFEPDAGARSRSTITVVLGAITIIAYAVFAASCPSKVCPPAIHPDIFGLCL